MCVSNQIRWWVHVGQILVLRQVRRRLLNALDLIIDSHHLLSAAALVELLRP
jgi:hypothetical protein